MTRNEKHFSYRTGTVAGAMRVKIVRMPAAKDADWLDTSRFQLGGTYEVGPKVAEYLLACGYAVFANEPSGLAADRSDKGPG